MLSENFKREQNLEEHNYRGYLKKYIWIWALHKNCEKFPADLVTFTEKILNRKPHLLCSVG